MNVSACRSTSHLNIESGSTSSPSFEQSQLISTMDPQNRQMRKSNSTFPRPDTPRIRRTSERDDNTQRKDEVDSHVDSDVSEVMPCRATSTEPYKPADAATGAVYQDPDESDTLHWSWRRRKMSKNGPSANMTRNLSEPISQRLFKDGTSPVAGLQNPWKPLCIAPPQRPYSGEHYDSEGGFDGQETEHTSPSVYEVPFPNLYHGCQFGSGSNIVKFDPASNASHHNTQTYRTGQVGFQASHASNTAGWISSSDRDQGFGVSPNLYADPCSSNATFHHPHSCYVEDYEAGSHIQARRNSHVDANAAYVANDHSVVNPVHDSMLPPSYHASNIIYGSRTHRPSSQSNPLLAYHGSYPEALLEGTEHQSMPNRHRFPSPLSTSQAQTTTERDDSLAHSTASTSYGLSGSTEPEGDDLRDFFLARPEGPLNREEERLCKQEIFNAMMNTDFAEDNAGMIKNWKNLSSNVAAVERVAGKLLECLKERESLREEKSKSKGSRLYRNFSERFEALLHALLTQKTCCKHLLAPPFIDQLVNDPDACVGRISNNRKVNANKKEAIEKGREVLGGTRKGKRTRQPLSEDEDADAELETSDGLPIGASYSANSPSVPARRPRRSMARQSSFGGQRRETRREGPPTKKTRQTRNSQYSLSGNRDMSEFAPAEGRPEENIHPQFYSERASGLESHFDVADDLHQAFNPYE